jgi:hypothetical protein
MPLRRHDVAGTSTALLSMHRLLSIVLLALALAPLPARAQQASTAPDGEPAEYDGLVDAALAEFAGHRWAEARTLFEHAHAVFPNARTLRGVGMAAFELRDYVAAVRALEAALASTARPLTDEQRAQVSALLERARVFVGEFGIGPAPAGSTLIVDGVEVAPDGDLTSAARVALSVGAHELELRAPDGRTDRAQVTVHGGESAALELSIVDAASVDATRIAERPDRAPVPVSSASTDPAPWVLVGVGGAVSVAGAILLGVGVSDGASVGSAAIGTEWADLEGAYGRAEPLAIGGGVALGVGLVCAGVGIAWAVSSPSSVEVSIGPGSASVRGTF